MSGADKQSMVEGLVASHGSQLRLFLMRRVRSQGDIPDLMQEIFLRMLRIPDHESIRSPEAYLFTVARHVVQQHTLRQSAAPILTEFQDVLAESRFGQLADPELEVRAQQCMSALQRALDAMPPRPRAAFLLHRRDGYTLEQIGHRLGVSRPMVKKYLARALVLCREHIQAGE